MKNKLLLLVTTILIIFPFMTVNAMVDEDAFTVNQIMFISEGDIIDTVDVFDNNRLIIPSDPVKENATFLGWYTDSTLLNKYDFNKPVTENIKLYAKWKYGYQIVEDIDYKLIKKVDNNIKIKLNNNSNNLIAIKINTKLVNLSNFIYQSDSNIIEIKKEYINSLSDGMYGVEIVYTDGSVKTEFALETSEKGLLASILSTTDAISNGNLSIAVLGLSIVGVVFILFYEKKKDTNK